MKPPPLRTTQARSPVLTKIMTDLSAKVTEPNKEAYRKVVLAGEKLLFDPKTHKQLELVKNPESRQYPQQTIAKGIANLMWLLYAQSKKTMGFEPMIIGGLTLMCDVIDFAERGLGIKFTEDMIAETSKLSVEAMFQKLGIKPEDLDKAIHEGGAEIDEYKRTGQMPKDPVFLRPLKAGQEQQPQQEQPAAQPQPGALS